MVSIKVHRANVLHVMRMTMPIAEIMVLIAARVTHRGAGETEYLML